MTTPMPLKLSGTQKKSRDDSLHAMTTHSQPWKVLIVDDDEEVHKLTKMVLTDYQFQNRSIDFYSAYSSVEAIEKLTEYPDFSVVLLDVVMETDDAGLQTVRKIREQLGNRFIRIILRTGQPGNAPEDRVIMEYDINDYKEKTELTASKLTTAITTALRSWQDLKTIEHSRRGLEKICGASKSVFDLKSQKTMARAVLEQLTSILSSDNDSIYLQASGISAAPGKGDYVVGAATGKYAGSEGQLVRDTLCKEDAATAFSARKDGSSNNIVFKKDCFAGFFKSNLGDEALLFFHWPNPLGDLDRNLIEIFSNDMAIAFENFSLNHELIETQREVILILGEVMENRSNESANHVKRVAEYAKLIGELLGLNQNELELLCMASPMHDVGKIGIPDAILNKPGKLTDDEFVTMKNHSEIGNFIFQKSTRPIMKAAGIIAHQHHEKWNGTGYPQGLKGKNIHIFGRIVAAADVFDAMICRRCYKAPWSPDRVRELFKKEAGGHFDPHIADLVVSHFDELLKIHKHFPDVES